MNLEERIDILSRLGTYLLEKDERLLAYLNRTFYNNNWFTIDEQINAVESIAHSYLNKESLSNWLNNYSINNKKSLKIGLIPAANIPLVGFHDVMTIFISGNIAVIKLSERDPYVLPYLVKKMTEMDERVADYFDFPKYLPIKELDGVIATGSDNSSRYFEQYFKNIPNIIRKNRTSIAVLNGKEKDADLKALGKDIFQYFGLGCRNVSKLFIPKDYDLNRLLEILHDNNSIILHDKYKNNFDYQITLFILNNFEHYNNGCVILAEKEELVSPISVVFFEYYDNKNDLEKKILSNQDKIQCIVSNEVFDDLNTISFGKAQEPQLSDYADGVDTLQFLLEQV